MSLNPSWRALLAVDDFIPVPLNDVGLPLIPPPEAALNDGKDPWVVIGPASARLSPDFTHVVRQQAESRRDVDLFYADEVEQVRPGDSRLLLKPATNLTLLISDDYIGSPIIMRSSAFHRIGGFRWEADTAIAYDLMLRAIREGFGIERIPKVMVAHDGLRPRPLIEHRR